MEGSASYFVGWPFTALVHTNNEQANIVFSVKDLIQPSPIRIVTNLLDSSLVIPKRNNTRATGFIICNGYDFAGSLCASSSRIHIPYFLAEVMLDVIFVCG